MPINVRDFCYRKNASILKTTSQLIISQVNIVEKLTLIIHDVYELFGIVYRDFKLINHSDKYQNQFKNLLKPEEIFILTFPNKQRKKGESEMMKCNAAQER